MALVALQDTTVTVGVKTEGTLYVYWKHNDVEVTHSVVPFRLTALINGPDIPPIPPSPTPSPPPSPLDEGDVDEGDGWASQWVEEGKGRMEAAMAAQMEALSGKSVIVGGEAGNLVSMRVSDGSVLHAYVGHYADVNWLFVVDNMLISASSVDRSLRRWDTANGDCLMRYVGPDEIITAALVKPNVGAVFAGSFDGNVYVWKDDWAKQLSPPDDDDGEDNRNSPILPAPPAEPGESESDEPGSNTDDPDHGAAAPATPAKRKGDAGPSSSPNPPHLLLTPPYPSQWMAGASPQASTPVTTPWKVFRTHTKYIHCLEADPSFLYSASNDKTIGMWDIQTGACIAAFVESRKTSTQYMLREGDYLFAANKDKTVRKWDVGSGTCVSYWEEHQKTIFALKVCGDHLFSSSMDKSVCMWSLDPETETPLVRKFEGHHGRTIRSIELDGTYLYSASEDGTVSKWDVASGAHIHKFDNQETRVTAMYVDRTRDAVFFARGRDLYRWCATTAVAVMRYFGAKSDILVAKVVHNDQLWAAGTKPVTCVWDVETGARLFRVSLHSRSVYAMVSSGPYVYTGSLDKSIYKCSVLPDSPAIRLRNHTKSVQKLALYRGILFSGSYDHTLVAWDVETHEALHRFTGHTKSIKCMLLTEGLLFSGSFDHDIRVWDMGHGFPAGPLRGHRKSVVCLAVEVVPGSEVADSACVVSPSGVLNVPRDVEDAYASGEITPGPAILYSGSDDCTVRAWDLQSYECVAEYSGHLRGVVCLLVEPGGAFILSGSADGQIRRWQTSTGACVRVFDGHHNSIVSMVLLSRSTFLSSSSDGTIRRWKLGPPSLRELCLSSIQNARVDMEFESALLSTLCLGVVPADVKDAILGRVPGGRSEVFARVDDRLGTMFPEDIPP